jgi:hypothetical protein
MLSTGRAAVVLTGDDMRLQRHTPGPWAWDGDYTLRAANPDPDTSDVHTILYIESAGSGFVGSDPAATMAELEANRRLIAAAPDLLFACKEALDFVLKRGTYYDLGLAKFLNDAIEKAGAT